MYLALKACLVAFQRASKLFGIIAKAEGNERPLKVRNPMAQMKGVITESMSLPSATAATHQLHFAKSMLKMRSFHSPSLGLFALRLPNSVIEPLM